MKYLGYLVLVAALVAAGAWYGGYLNGDVDVQLTDKGRDTYNQGVEVVQDRVGQLKMDTTKPTSPQNK